MPPPPSPPRGMPPSPPACRRREESFAVENDRSEGGLTLIAGNTWWNTRGSRPGTVGTKGPPCDLSLIVLPSPSDWPTTSKTVLPRHYSPHSIYDPRRASWPDTNLLSLSLSHSSRPVTVLFRLDRPRNRTGIGGDPISSAEEMDLILERLTDNTRFVLIFFPLV